MKQLIRIINKQEKRLFFYFLTLLSLSFGFLSIRNHDQFQTFAWDLGFFDQLIWKASRFSYPYSTIGGLTILGDHFQPVLYLLIPLYWLWSNVRVILLAQAFLVVFSSIPLYLLAKEVLSSKLAAWSVALSFLFFTGTQFTVTNEFHQSAFIPLFLNGIFWFYYTKRWSFYWLMVIGLMATREEMALLVAAIGIFFTLRKTTRKIGWLTLYSGLIGFVLLIYLLIPLFNPKGVYPHFNYGEAGKTPQAVLLTILRQPGFFFKSLVSPSVKLKTLFSSFFSFAFLPFFSPSFLIPIMQQFSVRFIDTQTIHRWLNLNHYAIPLASLMAVSSIFGISNLRKMLKLNEKKVIKEAAICLFIFTGLQNIIYHGPINSLFKRQLYESQPWVKDNYQVLRKIPPWVKIAAQNSLVPHLSQREEIYLLPEIGEAEYIWVDLEDGPNKYAPLNLPETETLIESLLEKGEYMVFYNQGESWLLKKQ